MIIKEQAIRSIKRTASLILCMCVGSAIAVEPLRPPDVAKFVDQREGCDHFRGEIPDPSELNRMKEVERALRRLSTGTDKNLANLKIKYAKNRPVLVRLNEFEN